MRAAFPAYAAVLVAKAPPVSMLAVSPPTTMPRIDVRCNGWEQAGKRRVRVCPGWLIFLSIKDMVRNTSLSKFLYAVPCPARSSGS